MTNELKAAGARAPRVRKIIVTVLTTLVLGAIGSGVWEVLFRPGLSWVGKILSEVSARFENDIYRSAALDPQPLPGLILLLILSTIPLCIAAYLLMEGFVRKPLEGALQKRLDNELANAAEDKAEAIFDRSIKRVSVIGALAMAAFFGLFFIGFTLQNEAISVWRISQANLEISAAYAPDSEMKRLRALFRSMQTRADFDRFRTELDRIPNSASRKLDWYGI
jgi:hypothetical protein